MRRELARGGFMRLGVALLLGCSIDAFLGCSIDDRTVGIDNKPLQPDASVPDPGGSAGSAGSGGADESVAPLLGIEPAALDFGGSVVGFPSRGRVSITNSGTAPLAAPSAVLLPGSDPDYVVLHNQCENSVAPGEHCDVRVQLVPSKEGGSSATLGVQSSGQGVEASFSASGLRAGPLTLSPAAGSSSDLGGVTLGGSVEAAFEVSNPGTDSAGPLSISVNQGQFSLLPPSAEGCQPGAALLGGQRCSVRVGFTPTRRGPADGALLVTSSLGSTALPLEGRGQLPASLAAPDALEFGGVVVGTIGFRTLLVENAGDGPLELAGVALASEGETGAPAAGAPTDIPPATPPGAPPEAAAAGADASAGAAFSVQNSDCSAGRVLAGGERCSVRVGFRPQVAGANQQTALVVSAAGGERNVALAGSGVSEGALTLGTAPGASANFGDLAVGQSARQQFVITNPTAQPSGALDIQTVDDFVLEPGSLSGECQSGVTSLVNGESCSITVTFTPSLRGQRDGALVVGSVLSGGVNLPLEGRGLAPAALAVTREELDFGRVPTQAPVQQSLTVANHGDLPLTGLHATLEAPGGGAASGFSMLGECAGELAAGAACELSLQFLPTEASAYAALLRLSGEAGGSVSTLLVGRAFPRGSLELAAAAGSNDFGDVVIGGSSMLSFSLTNPGAVASGHIALSSSSNAFSVAQGDCNPDGSAGLVNGSSCTFTVTFTPTTSDALTTNLSVQSPGAGETALALTGRGRTPASLTAASNRDFGLANVNENALTNPTNQFTWTLTNGGDLASGPLAVVNSNALEFIVSNDTCSNASVAGHGSCSMDVRFRPSAAGARTANLSVTDAQASRTLRLAMTGNGRLIVGPGQACVNATCSSGTCTAGVCCDRACVGSCEACSSAGVCTAKSGREMCGNGGQCFGLNRCLLPESQPCTTNGECGSNNCEPRLNGQGANDLICCLDDCGTTGQQCNAQTGRCETPALGEGEACVLNAQPACEGDLECKLCGGTNRRECIPSDTCCGTCPSGYACVNGACGCPGGTAQVDCGNGLCIPAEAGRCCPSSPQCPANLPACDSRDNRCKECLSNAQCSGANRVCGPNNTCVCSGCQIGNTCFASGAVNPTNPCQICLPSTSSTAFSSNSGANCGAGPATCSGQDTCSAAGACQANHFGSGVTCSGGVCNGSGTCLECLTSAQCTGANRVCGPNNTCVCSGCQIGNTCFASGAVNPTNACQICRPATSSSAFSSNGGANCGAGPTACSGQDTCSTAGACQANNFGSGVACTGGGTCNGSGTCNPPSNPFTCANANPPRTIVAFERLSQVTGNPPGAQGGTIRDGRYELQSIEVYGADVAPAFFVREMTFEFRLGFAQVGYQTWIGSGAVVGSPELSFVGSFTSTGTSLQFNMTSCNPDCTSVAVDAQACSLPSPLPYTATATGLVTIRRDADRSTVVTTYSRL